VKNGSGEACSRYSERRGVYRVLVGNPEGETTLRIRHRLEGNIKMALQELA